MARYKKIGLTQIAYINPLELEVSNPRKRHSQIRHRSWVNGTFFSMADSMTWMWVIFKGKQLCYRGGWYKKPMGTLIIWKDGTVEVKKILDIPYEKRKDVHLAIQGCDAFPGTKQSIIDQGFSPREIGRFCKRPMLGYNPTTHEIIITVRSYSTAWRGHQTLVNLGCDRGIFLDAGGSTNARFNGRVIAKTRRRLGTILHWG